MRQILVIDDNPDILEALALLLSLHDYQVHQASDIQSALLVLARCSIDLVIQDMNFSQGTTSGSEGVELFNQIKQSHPTLPVIIITAWSQLETAIELVKGGAIDYLPKPWDDAKLISLIQKQLVQPPVQANSDLIYRSQPMQQLVAMAKKVAPSELSVLITGANGSGKECLADFIHQQSDRASGPLIKVNMGALPSELIEAELFGAEKGAFTGAQTSRIGRFEASDGGTIFLDEIGNLSLDGQMKLLRVLQTGEYQRVGSSKTDRCDVRVISATNADLLQQISQGDFREDLYYRLNMVELAIAPLHQRREDILPLTEHFIGADHQLSSATKDFLLNQPWHGNVRELENCCKRAVVFCDNKRLEPQDFSVHSMAESITTHGATCRETHSSSQVLDALNQHQWNIAQTAQTLGLSRQSLYRRIEKYQLSQPTP